MPASPTTTPTTTEAEVTKPKPTPRKRTPNKAKPKKVTPSKKGYPTWVAPAVLRSRKISGMKPGSGGDATMAFPGPKQHIAIRKIVTAKIEGDVTPAAILKVSGIKSLAVLKRIATWEADKSEMKPMRALSAECGAASGVNGNSDGWATGRYLASALVAWIEELKSAKS